MTRREITAAVSSQGFGYFSDCSPSGQPRAVVAEVGDRGEPRPVAGGRWAAGPEQLYLTKEQAICAARRRWPCD